MTKRAASYSRVSTGQQEQDGTSLDTQAVAIASFIKERGYSLATEHIYRDVHSGGEYRERPELSRLREAVRGGEVDVVVFYAIDRLSRNQTHLAVLVDEIESHGVELACVTEEWDDSAVGKAIRNLRAFAAETEREKIAERSTRGRLARLANGKMLPGPRPPYGYRWIDEEKSALTLDPDTSPIVLRIFTDVANGIGARTVAKRLTAEGIPSPSGNSQWAVCSITQMLRKEVYTGTFRSRTEQWEKVKVRVNGEAPRTKRVRHLRPESEHIVFEVPALVTPELAQAAVGRLSHNRSQAVRNNKDPERALLRGGFARCGYCGYVLNANNHGRGRVMYACNPSNRDKFGCPHYGVETHLLDAWVWEAIASRLNDPEVIAAEVEELRQSDPTEADLTTVERRLGEVTRKQSNLIKRLADVDDDHLAGLVQAELASLTKQTRQLNEEHASLLQERESWRLAQERLSDLIVWCERVAENLAAFGYEDKREVLYAMGVEVRVWKSDHEPRFELKASIPIMDGASRNRSTRRDRRSGTSGDAPSRHRSSGIPRTHRCLG